MPLFSVLHSDNEANYMNFECTAGALNTALVELGTSCASWNATAAPTGPTGKSPAGTTGQPLQAHASASAPPLSAQFSMDAGALGDSSSAVSSQQGVYHRMELIPLSFVTELATNSKAVSALQQLGSARGAGSGTAAATPTASGAAASSPCAGAAGSSTVPNASAVVASLLHNIPFVGLMVAPVHVSASEQLGIAPNTSYVLIGCRESLNRGGRDFCGGGLSALNLHEEDTVSKSGARSGPVFTGGSGGGAIVSGTAAAKISALRLAQQEKQASQLAASTAEAAPAGLSPAESAALLRRAKYTASLPRPELTMAGERGRTMVVPPPPVFPTLTGAVGQPAGGPLKSDDTYVGPCVLVTTPLPPEAGGTPAPGQETRVGSAGSNALPPPNLATTARGVGEGFGKGKKSTSNNNSGRGAAANHQAEVNSAPSPTVEESSEIPLSTAAEGILTSQTSLVVSLSNCTVALRGSQTSGSSNSADQWDVNALHGHILEHMESIDVLWKGSKGEHEVLSLLLQEYLRSMKQKIEVVQTQAAAAMASSAAHGNGTESKKRKGGKGKKG